MQRLRCCAALLGLALLALASPAQGATFGTGFEDGLSGWEATGLWNVQDHPELVTVSPDIAGRLSDVPPGATLPSAFDGTHAAWFGDPASGTYCAGFANVHQHPSNGCTSDGVVTGTLTSPAFALAPGPASLSFEAWWEISGGSPDLTDLMLVDYSTGIVAKVAPFTQADDVAVAQSQSAAMAKAKTSLKEAIDKATSEAARFRAVARMRLSAPLPISTLAP